MEQGRPPSPFLRPFVCVSDTIASVLTLFPPPSCLVPGRGSFGWGEVVGFDGLRRRPRVFPEQRGPFAGLFFPPSSFMVRWTGSDKREIYIFFLLSVCFFSLFSFFHRGTGKIRLTFFSLWSAEREEEERSRSDPLPFFFFSLLSFQAPSSPLIFFSSPSSVGG